MSDLSLILWWPVVELISGVDDRFSACLSATAANFPDRSALVTGEGVASAWEFLERYRSGGLELRQNTIYESLDHLPFHRYQLLVPSRYFHLMGGEEDFLVACGHRSIAPVTDTPLEAKRVRVVFARKPNGNVEREFREHLIVWGARVCERGVFGEGGVVLEARSISFEKRCCTFNVDLRGTGQQTVNWLVLHVLNFGSEKWPVSEVRFWEDAVSKSERAGAAAEAIERYRRMMRGRG